MAHRKALFIALILLVTIPQPVLAIDEVVDDYEDETKVAGKHQIVRNTTYDAMELEWGSTLALDSPMDIWTTGGFTEVDPGEDNLQNINGTEIWFNQVDRDEGDRIYKDFGANYFDGSWEYHFRVKIMDWQVSNARAYFMGFSETTTSFYTAKINDDDLIAFFIFWPAAAARWELSLVSIDEGDTTADTVTSEDGLDLDKWYHVTYIRDGDTVTAWFYNDALKTSLDFMLTVVDEGVSDLRYFHPLNSEDQATGDRSMAMWFNWVRNRTLIAEGYLPDGHFYTTDVLDGINYTAQAVLLNSTIPNDDSLTIEFSKDNSTWVDHNNVTGSDNVIAGYEAIDLRDLNYTTLYFRFNFTGGAVITSTPRLYQLRLIHEAPGEEVAVNFPSIISITFNTTVAEEACGVYSQFSDAEGLDGYIFWNNATSAPGGVNSTFTGLAGVSDYTQENVTLPSSGTKFGVKYYVNDTDGNWAVDTLAMFPTIEIEGDIIQMGGSGIIMFCIAIIIPIAFYMVKKR